MDPKILSEAEVAEMSKRLEYGDQTRCLSALSVDESAALAHTVQALRATLREYAQHHDYCPMRRSASLACECGFREAMGSQA